MKTEKVVTVRIVEIREKAESSLPKLPKLGQPEGWRRDGQSPDQKIENRNGKGDSHATVK